MISPRLTVNVRRDTGKLPFRAAPPGTHCREVISCRRMEANMDFRQFRVYVDEVAEGKVFLTAMRLFPFLP